MTETPEILPLKWDANWSSIWDRIAAASPDDPAIVEQGRTRSYRELEDRAAPAHRVEAGDQRRHGSCGLHGEIERLALDRRVDAELGA